MQRLTIVGMAAAIAVSGGLALGGCTVRRSQPNLVGQDIRLTVIHTADIHSRLFPYNFVPNTFDQGYGLVTTNAPFGGIARISTLVKQIRRASNRSLWLDSGDSFQGAPVFNEFRGEAEMRALTVAGLDGAVLGNHEFDRGARNLFDKIDNWAGYPLLAANYAWGDPPPAAAISNGRSLRDVVTPYEIYDVQGLRVGVIGMGNTGTITSIYEGGSGISEFNGLTEVGFPVMLATSDAVTPDRQAPPAKLDPNTWFNGLSDSTGIINFERNEAAPIEIDGPWSARSTVPTTGSRSGRSLRPECAAAT